MPNIGQMQPDPIIRLIRNYAAARGKTPGYVGKLSSGSGNFYSRLIAGHDITTRRASRILQWFSDHWPVDLSWPAEIPRPEPLPDSPAATAAAAPTLAEQWHSATAAQIEAELARLEDGVDAAMMCSDHAAAIAGRQRSIDVATAVGPDGKVISPKAICRVLGAQLDQFYDVVRQFADGAAGEHKTPRRQSLRYRMLELLVLGSNDCRFAERRMRWGRRQAA